MLSRCKAVVLLFSLFLVLTAPVAGQTPETKAAPAESGAAERTEGAPGARKRQPETVLEFAIAGGWVMAILLVCSVVWLGFFVERLFVLRRKKVFPLQLQAGLVNLLDRSPFDRDQALTLVRAHPSPAALVFQAAIERLHLPLDRIEKGVQNAGSEAVYQLRDRLWIFAIVATVAPLLGLLGTVMGLVQAFREVANSGLGAAATLAPGIYEALITTVGGLATAIPALVVYYWLQARIDRYVHEIDCAVTRIVDSSPASTT